MGALGHFIEREGVATTSISLIREHSEYMNPPRALWVPFYLGRPLGVPNDPDFQRDVLRATLNLLQTLDQHSIVDYPVEAPGESFSDTWACPVSFEAPDADSLSGRLRAESQRLAPWWLETYRARTRTLVGASAPLPDEPGPELTVQERVETLVSVLSAVAEGASIDAIPEIDEASINEVAWSHQMPFLLRHIVQDLRCYYQEAVAAQPGALSGALPAGQSPSHHALNDWFFNDTVLGEAIIEVGRRLTEAGDPRLRILRGWIVPEGYWPDGNTWGVAQGLTDRLALADEADKLLSGRE